MSRRSALLIGMMLFLSILVFNVQAQEAKRLGLNTTIRNVGEEIKSIQGLGVSLIRMPLEWQLIKIRPGEYDWTVIDRLVKAAQTRQVEVLLTIRSRVEAEKEKTQKQKIKKGSIQITPIDPPSVNKEQWVHFVETLANRYRGQGVNYELGNEVNEETSWKGTREEYLELLALGYDAIKKADPQAKVLPSAMGCGILRNYKSGLVRQEAWKWHDSWLQPILSTKKFDVVNIHNYYFPSDIVANGLLFRSYLEHIQELMRKSGVGDWPIWITEIGYVSSPTETDGRMDNSSPEKQARWLNEAYQQAFELGVERVYWYLLYDRKEIYFGSMGLGDSKGNPRPAWDALKKFK
jgi:Cellulase (glycosyl hydrolase family 5)